MATVSAAATEQGRSTWLPKLQAESSAPISSPKARLAIESGAIYALSHYWILCNNIKPLLMVKPGSRLGTAYNLSASEEDLVSAYEENLFFVVAAWTVDVSKSRDCQGSDPRTLDLNDSRGIRQSTPDLIYHVILQISTRINYPHLGSSAAAGSLLRLEINQIPQI